MTNLDRASLRRDLRHKRRSLSRSEQRHAARQLYHQVVTRTFFIRARRIAFYFASDAEIDPLAIMFKALAMGKQCFLPVLTSHRPNKVCFAPYQAGDSLRPNRWGILEPTGPIRQLAKTRTIDLVFVPLVGFDSHCNRLGMGKGYYDRTFAFRARSGHRQPSLVGLAHECQKLTSVPTADWDVPLDRIVSDRRIYDPR